MDYSIEQRIQIIKIYWENQCEMEATIQKLEEVFDAQGVAVPNIDEIRLLEMTFLETGSIRNEEFPSSDDDYGEEEEEAEEDDEEQAGKINLFEKYMDDYHAETEDADR